MSSCHSFRRFFPLAAFIFLVGLQSAGGLSGQPPPKGAPPADPPKSPTPDSAAQEVLAAALKQLDPKRSPWIEATVWQQADAQGAPYRADGKFLAGPNRQMRLSLRVQLAGSTGALDYVCDGKTFWDEVRLDDTRRVRKLDLKQIEDGLRRANVSQKVWDEFVQNLVFTGVTPLLQSIKQNAVPTKVETMYWRDRPVSRVTLAWSGEVAKSVTPTQQHLWPGQMPRSAYLYLDATTRWPWRIEWRGPGLPGGRDMLLWEVEFREPRFDPPADPAAAFRFDPGKTPVSDNTEGVLKELIGRGGRR